MLLYMGASQESTRGLMSFPGDFYFTLVGAIPFLLLYYFASFINFESKLSNAFDVIDSFLSKSLALERSGDLRFLYASIGYIILGYLLRKVIEKYSEWVNKYNQSFKNQKRSLSGKKNLHRQA